MPSHPFTHQDLERILIERVGLRPHELPDDPDTAFADLGLDSLAVVEVQRAVEQAYGFAIADADASVMTTLADVIDYVNGQLELPKAA